jgi:chromosome partitioning protein
MRTFTPGPSPRAKATPAPLLSTQQVAERLGVDKKTVLRYLHSGKLKGSRIGRDYRIAEGALTDLIDRPNGNLVVPTPRNEALITAVVNQKGGVGKTTTVFNLGVALQNLGRRVLLVDLDPQAALSASAGIPIAHLTVSIYQALLDDTLDPIPIIHPTSSGVDVLPATLDLAAAEVELVNVTLRELVLKDLLAKLTARYDHILIDCPPSLGLLTINALAAAHQVIIPLPCEFLATRGLNLLLRTLDKVRGRLNRDLKVAGILPTMFDGRTTNAHEILEELRTSFPDEVYDVVIKQTVRLKESPAAGLSILEYDRNHDVARSYRQLAEEVDRG